MVNIITEEVIIKNTEIHCSYNQREIIEKRLKRGRYNQGSLLSLNEDTDYMVGSVNRDDYVGSVVWIISKDFNKHNKLIELITKLIIENGDNVKRETNRKYENKY
jgi:hypothetical protein